MPCLVLDAMGVIFAATDDVAELLIPFIAEQGGTTDEETIQSVYLAASLGEIGADEFWARVGLTTELEDTYLARHSLNPGILELLSAAQAAGIPICCLSNDLGRWSRKLRQRLGVEAYLQRSVISAEVGMRKPQVRIYQAFLDASGYAAKELLFVDDRNTNVVAAREFGIDSILFDPQSGFDQVRSWLARQT